MQENIHIELTSKPLLWSKVDQFIKDPACGGEVIFTGTVRNQTGGKIVIGLEFEAYEPMAIKEMENIAAQAMIQWPVSRIAIHHRVGRLDIGEIPVIIGVSAPHRKEAFQACQYAIDTLKQTVPIWKKELFEDGEVWVASTP